MLKRLWFYYSLNTQKDIFLHVSALEKSKLRTLKENQKIQFEIQEEKGKLKAINLKRS